MVAQQDQNISLIQNAFYQLWQVLFPGQTAAICGTVCGTVDLGDQGSTQPLRSLGDHGQSLTLRLSYCWEGGELCSPHSVPWREQ